ncbi:hypothetical protein GWI33_014646 [Rhynchophorus ferrugineus]|uniref:Uncharacterized protein n=1 Tax=Rhynchophorus ferrugineus TaxID=354439 RepID=A0A834IER6_RHYFE|nr:hypothetical protein GWI33_014646 [Rhynchophorus ferrugineus]
MVADVVLCVSDINHTASDIVRNEFLNPTMPELPDFFTDVGYVPSLWAMVGSILVGLSGVLPLLVIPIDQTDNLKQGDSANKLKSLLSFAVGGLLGDVFLHSLPEIWANEATENGGRHSMKSGLLILGGLITFVITEKLFGVIEKEAEDAKESEAVAENNNTKGLTTEGTNKKHISGYLNLIANTIDNFTHGLSLGGAFLVSPRLGFLTTFAILVHEIPHEVGDFAILLRSGFTRWHAAVFQLLTAGGGLVGALFAIVFSGAKNSLEARTSWILPFTAGTFLHIGLVTVLPDLLKEEDPKESLKQMLALITGIVIMGVVTTWVE